MSISTTSRFPFGVTILTRFLGPHRRNWQFSLSSQKPIQRKFLLSKQYHNQYWWLTPQPRKRQRRRLQSTSRKTWWRNSTGRLQRKALFPITQTARIRTTWATTNKITQRKKINSKRMNWNNTTRSIMIMREKSSSSTTRGLNKKIVKSRKKITSLWAWGLRTSRSASSKAARTKPS